MTPHRAPRLDPVFARGVRDALVDRAAVAGRHRPRVRRWWVGAGMLGALVVAGGTAFAVTALVEPGGTVVTSRAEPVEATRTGTSTVELGPVPDGATHVALQLTCLDAGRFVTDSGPSMTCTDEDALREAADLAAGRPTGMSWSVAVPAGDRSVQVTTDPGARWHLLATFVDEVVTEWATNANGDTYGVANEHGVPDLVQTYATNGRVGYVSTQEVEELTGGLPSSPAEAIEGQQEREGKTFRVPVYESDGETVVGELVIDG